MTSDKEFSEQLIKWQRFIWKTGVKFRIVEAQLEDYVGDVNLMAWGARKGFDSTRGSFSTWLSRVCLTVASHDKLFRARLKRIPRSKLRSLYHKDGKFTDIEAKESDREAAYRDMEDIRPEIERLPRCQRIAIEGVLDGKLQKEIAIEEKTTRQCVSFNYRHGIETLRRRLTQSAALCD